MELWKSYNFTKVIYRNKQFDTHQLAHNRCAVHGSFLAVARIAPVIATFIINSKSGASFKTFLCTVRTDPPFYKFAVGRNLDNSKRFINLILLTPIMIHQIVSIRQFVCHRVEITVNVFSFSAFIWVPAAVRHNRTSSSSCMTLDIFQAPGPRESFVGWNTHPTDSGGRGFCHGTFKKCSPKRSNARNRSLQCHYAIVDMWIWTFYGLAFRWVQSEEIKVCWM